MIDYFTKKIDEQNYTNVNFCYTTSSMNCFYCQNIETKITKLKTCSYCRMAFYCSENCITQHWIVHKIKCRKKHVISTF